MRWSTWRTSCAGCASTALQHIRGPALEVVIAATSEVRSGILYATVIIVLVFLPLFALSGIEGRLFAPLGIAFIVSILASLVTAITLTPVLAYWLLPRMRRLAHTESGLVRVLKRGQERGLRWCFARPAFTIGLPAVAVLWAGLAAWQLPRAFLPPFNEGTALVSVVLQPGISLKESAVSEQLPSASSWRCRRCIRSAAVPAGPSSTSMPKACT